MSTVWELNNGEHYYRVASAGGALRLYTNGVFHSQWNKNKPFSGHLWDLLSLPAFLLEKPPTLGLVLGVGGGAVIKTLQHFFYDLQVDAVDLDSVHIEIAKQQFLCDTNKTHFFEQNACEFVYGCKQSYDLIIDDLFLGDHSQQQLAFRSVEPTTDWMRHLSRRLTESGILVINMEAERQLRKCLGRIPTSCLGFQAIYSANTPRYENAIGIFCKQQVTLDILEENLKKFYSHTQTQNVLKPFHFTRMK